MKKITFLFLAMVAFCWQSNAQIFIEENLDSGLPTGWNQVSYFTNTTANYLCEGSGNFADNMYGSASNNGVFTSPNYAGISNATDTNVTFEWLSRPYQTNAIDYIIHVEYSTDDGTNWNSVSSFAVTTEEACTTYSETIPAASLPTSSDFKFRIRGDWQSGDSYFYLDNIYITQVISCPQPSALTATSISSSSAVLGWTENGSASLWNVEVVTAGTAATGTATDSGVANGFSKTGLMAATDYEFYVQADCSGDISAWAGPFAFTTICTSITPEYNADMSLNVPNCWDEADSGDATSGPADLGSGTWYASNHNGTPSNSINLWQSFRSDWIISPVFDLSAAAPSELKVYVALTNGYSSGTGEQMGSDDEVKLLMTTDNGTTWTTMQTWAQGSEPSEAGIEVTYDLTAVTGNVQFAFLGSEGTVDDSEDVYFHVSKFQVRETPSCVEPSALMATNITATTANLGWTLGGSEALWDIEWGVTGFTQGTGTTVTGATVNPHPLSGLTSETSYDFYVRADCGSGTSAWAGPFSFTTPCATLVPDQLEDFTTGFVPTACWNEATSGTPATGPSGLGGGNWSTDGFGNNGTTGAVRINLYSANVEDWILTPSYDLSTGGPHQMEFDFGVFGYNSTAAATLGSDDQIQVLISTDNGTTWVNLATYDNTYVTDAAGNHEVFDLTAYSGTVQFGIWATDGSTNDAEDNDIFIDNFQVRAIPSCGDVSNIMTSNITATSADLSWTASASAETAWEYVVQTAGTGTPAAAGTASATPSASASALTAETDYEVYVRANCGGSFGSWIGPVNFTTPCAAESAAYTADMSANVPDACWNEAGSGEVAAGPSGLGASSWKAGRAFTDADGNVVNSNVMNLYQGNSAREWLISPVFDLDAIGASGLLVKVAVTDYSGSGTSAATATDTMGSDDEVQLVMTTDNGTTWTNVTTWNVGNQPDVTGTDYILDLSGMTGSVQFAFFASDGTVDDLEDYDFHVGTFEVSNAVLSTVSFDNEAAFTYHPNPVKNTLTLNAQNTIDNVTMYNMLGQVVLNAKPNNVDSELDMSNLKSGAYFVKVTIANNTKTIKVIKQ